MLRVKSKHRLLCGDCTSADDVDALLNGERAELCFTSPPYVDQRQYGGGGDLSVQHISSFIAIAASACGMFAVNLGIVRREDEVVPYWDEYIASARAVGLKLVSWNVWDRIYPCSIGQQTAMFPIEHEWIFVFATHPRALKRTVDNKHAGVKTSAGSNRQCDGSMKPRWGDEIHDKRALGTILRQDIHRGESPHPAMFPVALPAAYIDACTNAGDIVYEPFNGSGTTIVACEQLSRRCFAMEINPDYADIALARWEAFTGRKAVLAC